MTKQIDTSQTHNSHSLTQLTLAHTNNSQSPPKNVTPKDQRALDTRPIGSPREGHVFTVANYEGRSSPLNTGLHPNTFVAHIYMQLVHATSNGLYTLQQPEGEPVLQNLCDNCICYGHGYNSGPAAFSQYQAQVVLVTIIVC